MSKGGTRALVIVWAVAADASSLAEIDRTANPHPWSEKNFLDELRPEGPTSVLLLRAPLEVPRPLGFCVLRAVADEGEIRNVAVVRRERRNGYGRLLLSVALDLLARRGARRIHLEVREGNLEARALYMSLGFRAMGRRSKYYSEPEEDAILFGRRAESSEGREP